MKCIVNGCVNCDADNKPGVRYHVFPVNSLVRKKWLTAIRRTDINPDDITSKQRVCSYHFLKSDYYIAGQITRLNKNIIPTIFTWPSVSLEEEVVQLRSQIQMLEAHLGSSEHLHQKNSDLHANLKRELSEVKTELYHSKLQIQRIKRTSKERLRNLKKKISKKKSTLLLVNLFKHSDKKMLYYTGIPNYKTFLLLFNTVLPSAKAKSRLPLITTGKCRKGLTKLTAEDQLFMTLIRLRRGTGLKILSDLFGISIGNVQSTCQSWVNLMYAKLGSLKWWPHRDVLIQNGPMQSQQDYPNVIGSIDCAEFLIERSSSLVTQSQCYSHYKSHTTLKSLIMVHPNGAIIYGSNLMTGSMSDKEIVVQSGFLNTLKRKMENEELLPGDTILADKGFLTHDLVKDIKLEINIPAFRTTGHQFEEEEIQATRTIAKEKIHVERAIRRLKSFKILTNTIPITMMGSINQIYTVCCLLSNFRYSQRN